MTLKTIKRWITRTPEPTLSVDEYVQKMWDDIHTPLMTKVYREAGINVK